MSRRHLAGVAICGIAHRALAGRWLARSPTTSSKFAQLFFSLHNVPSPQTVLSLQPHLCSLFCPPRSARFQPLGNSAAFLFVSLLVTVRVDVRALREESVSTTAFAGCISTSLSELRRLVQLARSPRCAIRFKRERRRDLHGYNFVVVASVLIVSFSVLFPLVSLSSVCLSVLLTPFVEENIAFSSHSLMFTIE